MWGFAYFMAYVGPISVFLGGFLGGFWVFLTPMIVLGLHPIADWFAAPYPPSHGPTQKEDPSFSWILWLYVPTQILLTLWTLYRIHDPSFDTLERLGLILSLGLSNGAIGFTAAHELIHRRQHWERGLGVLLLSNVSYAHFRIEHVFGHHRRVATRFDPASARLGEILYTFWFRSIWGGLKSAWRIEVKRAEIHEQSPWTLSNRMIQYFLLQGGIYLLLALIAGVSGVLAFAFQSVVAVLLLETINYIEHYGLERKKTGPKTYEPVSSQHSWDSDHRYTNSFLFNLGLHADHHQEPLKPYETLELKESSLKLPAGYSAMILLAMIPSLWKKTVDPLLLEKNASKTAE